MPDADYIYDCELALWPAVAGLYPDAVFGEIYDWVEESIFDEWTEAEFSKAAMAVELERLHTGSDEQFLGIFQRLRKVHSADVEPVSEKGWSPKHPALPARTCYISTAGRPPLEFTATTSSLRISLSATTKRWHEPFSTDP